MCLDPFYCAVFIDLEGKSKCIAHLLCLKLFGQFRKEKEAAIGWLRVDGEQTDFSLLLLPFMADAILSSLLPPSGPHVLEVTRKPAVVVATSGEVDLPTTQDPGPLQKPTWQVSRGLLF